MNFERHFTGFLTWENNNPPASEASRGVNQKWAQKISPTRIGSGSGVTLSLCVQ